MSDNSLKSSVDSIATIQENCKPHILSGLELCKIDIKGYSLNNFQTFNPTGYSVLCRLGENCDALNYFPATSKIVLNIGDQSQLSSTLQNLLPNIAKDLGISEDEALQTASHFFSNKNIVVQPVGIPGKFYNVMRTVQNYIPMMYLTEAVGAMKTTGLTGLQIITQAPLTFVGATYVGAMFFTYCGGVSGNNTVGVVFNFTGYVLSRPMRGVEIVLNGLALKPLSNLVGVPFMLNGTQEMMTGTGISVQEYSKIAFAFERLTNSTVVSKIKKIYRVLRPKN